MNLNRSELIKDEHLLFLDALRESGVTNMYGSGVYIETEFGVTKKEAREIVIYWMQTFGKEER